MSRRLSGPERRQTILTESQQLFAEKGFHGVSIDDIARAVDVSPAILYRHFDSKQVLYDAVLSELSSQRESYVNTVVNSGTSFEDVLAGMTHVFISSIDKNPNLLRIEMHSLLERNPATQGFFQNRWKSFADYIEFGLNQKLPRNLANREITILSASLMFQGMVREALIQKYLQLKNIVVGDDVSVSTASATGTFVDKNVGVNKTVNITGLSISGTDSSNYNFANPNATAQADITAAPLTITAQTNTKTYDATTTAAATPTIVVSTVTFTHCI